MHTFMIVLQFCGYNYLLFQKHNLFDGTIVVVTEY